MIMIHVILWFSRRDRKRKQGEKSSAESEAEVIDSGAELIKECTDAVSDDSKETSFENPTVEEIKQLQEEPKKLAEKKSD